MVNSFLIGSEGWVALIMPRGDRSILILIRVDGSDLADTEVCSGKSDSMADAERQKVSILSKQNDASGRTREQKYRPISVQLFNVFICFRDRRV